MSYFVWENNELWAVEESAVKQKADTQVDSVEMTGQEELWPSKDGMPRMWGRDFSSGLPE